MTKINGQVGISPEYVKNWTIGEAIREIVQNYLDSRAEFDCKGFIEYKALKKAGMREEGDELVNRIVTKGEAGSFEEALAIIGEYVEIV